MRWQIERSFTPRSCLASAEVSSGSPRSRAATIRLKLSQRFFKSRFNIFAHRVLLPQQESMGLLIGGRAARDGSYRHTRIDEVADLDFAAVADDGFSVGLEGQAVSAGENAQGAQGLETGGQPGGPVPAVEDTLFESKPGALSEVFQAGAGILDPGGSGLAQPLGEPVQMQVDFANVGDGDFAGLAGSERASVSGQVGQGDVDFVADGRDDRQARQRRSRAPRFPR